MRESSSSGAPRGRRFGVEHRVGFKAVYAAVVLFQLLYDDSIASA
ncbi:hypothetical protein [Caballeronia sp. KNU42]